MNEMLIFFKIDPLAFNVFIAVSFPLVEAPTETSHLILSEAVQSFLLISLTSSNLILEISFQLQKNRKVTWSCLWCYGYHCRKWTRQLEFKS